MDRYEMILNAFYSREVEVEDFTQAQVFTKVQEVMKLLLGISDEELIALDIPDPASQVAIIWSVEDVLGERPDLTEAQALKVLRSVKDGHNSEYGVTWETLSSHADSLYPELDDELDDTGRLLIGCYDHKALLLTPKAYYAIVEAEEINGKDFLKEYTWDNTIGWDEKYGAMEGVEVVERSDIDPFAHLEDKEEA